MADNTSEVAVLGPLGTYSHEAAAKAFGSTAIYKAQKTIANVFSALSSDIPFGVVPEENPIFGGVVETFDLFRTPASAFVRGEVTLKVEHCLLVKNGTKLHEITRIMSHEQALGQCRQFIESNLPGIEIVKTKSTAAAAEALVDASSNCAAICSSICVSLFPGLEILAQGVQDENSNFTRFYIIAHSSTTPLTSQLESHRHMKALMRVSSPECGPYSTNVARCLASLQLPITRIDRRPSLDGIPFHNVYFIEVQKEVHSHHDDDSFELWTKAVMLASSRVIEEGWRSAVVGIW